MNEGVSGKRTFLKQCGLCAVGIGLGLRRLDGLPLRGMRLAWPDPPQEEPGKWSKEALFYEKTEAGLQCRKCPNECLLGAGETGLCRNRVNYKGTLYSTAYGNPCAVHIDPIEKKPLFHFLPSSRAFSIATAGCNFACLNCQNWEISQRRPADTQNYDLMPRQVVDACASNKCASIAYTYSEPSTFYEYAYDTSVIARGAGLRNVWKSNGYLNEIPLRRLCKMIHAANIDLKVFDDAVYDKLSRGRLQPVLRTLRIMKEEHVWLEITNLVIPQWSDDRETIKKMCGWLASNGFENVPLHFTRFTPLYKLNQLPVTPVASLEMAHTIAAGEGLHYVYVGNVPGHPAESTYCHNCKKMILNRKGFVILENNITSGSCRFCGATIPGVWS